MAVLVRPPAPLLRGAVESLAWYRSPGGPQRLERSIPSGSVTLMVNLAQDEFRTWDVRDGRATPVTTGGAVLMGARSTPAVIDTDEQRHLVSVEFRWGGAAAFLAVPLEEVRDELVGLDELWGRPGARLRERLCEAPDPLRVLQDELLAQLRRAPRTDPGVLLAVAQLQRGRPVHEVADRLGWTGKRLLRSFRESVGLTPKRFARVRRLQRVVRGGRLGRRRSRARVRRPGTPDRRVPRPGRDDAGGVPPGRGARAQPRHPGGSR
jgi:AraC-like DNA-binding protein